MNTATVALLFPCLHSFAYFRDGGWNSASSAPPRLCVKNRTSGPPIVDAQAHGAGPRHLAAEPRNPVATSFVGMMAESSTARFFPE